MDDVRGDFLGPPHGTTPAAVIANKSSEHINEKMDGPYRGFDYKSLFSDPGTTPAAVIANKKETEIL